MADESSGSVSMVPDDFDSNDGNDSAFGDVEPSVISITESIMAYHEENGRRYQALSRGKYALPNDEVENERLDIQHELMVRTLDGQLCLCPKKVGARRVLDIGTGTGGWAMDYADANPGAEVVGVDLSPIQPPFVPPNCSFEIDDLEKPWTWSRPFDFIFCRMMLGSFADFPDVIRKAYDALEPGGYLEVQELTIPVRCDDDTFLPDSYLAQWCALILEAAARQNRPVFPTTKYKTYLEEAGFEAVVEVQRKWPSNPWPKAQRYKELGLWAFADLADGLEGLTLAHFTRGLGWSRERTLVFCAQVRKDLRNPRIHAYWPIYIVYGRKPDRPSVSAAV